MKPEPKYRPVMSESMLKECYSAVREGDTKEYLRKFLTKIGAGITSPGYVPTPANRSKPQNNLGFSDEEKERELYTPYSAGNASQLHQKFLLDPLSITEEEREIVETYRWEQGLLSEEESAAYEAKLFS